IGRGGTNMRYFFAVMGGAAVGAGAALLFAPKTGRATRAMLKDKATKYSSDAQEFVESKSRHLKNKMTGFRHEAPEMIEQGQQMMAQGMAQGKEMLEQAGP